MSGDTTVIPYKSRENNMNGWHMFENEKSGICLISGLRFYL